MGLENLASTKKNLFNDASPLDIEGLDSSKMSEASIRPVSHLESNLTCRGIAQEPQCFNLLDRQELVLMMQKLLSLSSFLCSKNREQGKAQVDLSQTL